MKSRKCYGQNVQMKILALIETAASEGTAAPTYVEIAKALGVEANGEITRTLRVMEDDGMIRVQKRGQQRRYYHALTGCWTDWSIDAREKRALPKRKCLSCPSSFRPTHKANYLCVPCKRYADNASPFAASGGWNYSDGRV